MSSAGARPAEARSHDTGSLLWEDRYDPSDFEQAFSATTLRDEVFVAGFVWNPPNQRDFLLRVLDQKTGQLVWQDQVDTGYDEFASGVVADDHRVFVSGTQFKPGTDYDWMLRAYDTCTHELLWENTFDLVGRSDFARGTALAVGGGMVFLGGYGTNEQDVGDFNTDWIVRAYDADSGELVWQDRIAGRSGAYSLTYQAGRLFAGGWSNTVQADNAVVRAYDARHGTRLWTRRLDLSGIDDAAQLVKADGGIVYVESAAGPLTLLSGCCTIGQWVVSAFDDSNGKLLWQTLGDDGDSGVYNMVADHGRLFIPGRAVDFATNDWDLIVRAYDARGRRGDVVFPTLRQVTGTGTAGTRSYGVTFDQAVTATAHGLVPVGEQAANVVDDPTNDINQAFQTGIGITLHTVTVPPGTRTLRVGLFDEDVDGTSDDLDLYVFDPDFNFVGTSGNVTSNESFTVATPVAGDYTVVVHGYETDGPDANYTLFTWVLGEAAAGNLTLSGANPVPAGGGRLTVTWSGLAPGGRYLGAVSYSDGTDELAQTLVSIHAVQ